MPGADKLASPAHQRGALGKCFLSFDRLNSTHLNGKWNLRAGAIAPVRQGRRASFEPYRCPRARLGVCCDQFKHGGKHMAKALEETLKFCKHCQRKTKHQRTYSKTGLVAFLVHLVLTIFTAGAWLVLLVLWKLLTTKVGGWTCAECGK